MTKLFSNNYVTKYVIFIVIKNSYYFQLSPSVLVYGLAGIKGGVRGEVGYLGSLGVRPVCANDVVVPSPTGCRQLSFPGIVIGVISGTILKKAK